MWQWTTLLGPQLCLYRTGGIGQGQLGFIARNSRAAHRVHPRDFVGTRENVIMRFSVGSNEWPANDRTFRGTWHLESMPDASQTGVLSIATSGYPTLILDGSLQEAIPDYSSHSVIGLTHEAVDVTLVDGAYRTQKAPWYSRVDYGGQRPPVIEEEWQGFAVAVGAKLPLGGDTPVREMVFRSRRLRDWASGSAPQFKATDEERSIGGTLRFPSDIKMTTVWGTVLLRWGAVGPYSAQGADLRYFPEVHVEFTGQPTVDQTWKLVITPLLQFFTLLTGEGDYLESVRYRTAGTHDDQDSSGTDSYGQLLWGGWFEWISASWLAQPNDKPEVSEFAHLVGSGEADANLEAMLSRWIDLQARAPEPLADYFATLMWSSMTFEESFAHIVRALEVLHSIVEPGPRIPKQDFKAVRTKIKQALEGDPHRELILSRLRHADAFSLLDRLTAILARVGYRLQNFAGDIDQFARMIRDVRDSFTHTSSLGEVDYGKLGRAHVILDLVMRSELLLQIGVPQGELDDRVFRTEAARLLLYPVNKDSN